ncbi:MAG: hypothetical protein RR620_13355 [Clostridium sp.]
MVKKVSKVLSLIITFNILFNVFSNGIVAKAECYKVVGFKENYSKEDVNKDGLINVVDLSLLASNYNCNSESLDWNSDYDLNNDKIIDLYDLVIIAKVIENEDGVEEDEFEPIVYVAKSIVTMRESVEAKHGIGEDKHYLLDIENLGFQESYKESIRLKNKHYKNDKYKAYADELYFICDSINNSISSYKVTNDEKYLKELESNLDKCKTFFLEIGEGYSEEEVILDVTKEILIIIEVIFTKYGDDVSSAYITSLERYGFQEAYLKSIELKDKNYEDESLKRDAERLYEICNSINNNMIGYKETNDKMYLELMKENFTEVREFFYYYEAKIIG